MTTNKYWLYLEALRRSGVVNMFGSAIYVMEEFGVSMGQAQMIVADWMKNYNRADYEGRED